MRKNRKGWKHPPPSPRFKDWDAINNNSMEIRLLWSVRVTLMATGLLCPVCSIYPYLVLVCSTVCVCVYALCIRYILDDVLSPDRVALLDEMLCNIDMSVDIDYRVNTNTHTHKYCKVLWYLMDKTGEKMEIRLLYISTFVSKESRGNPRWMNEWMDEWTHNKHIHTNIQRIINISIYTHIYILYSVFCILHFAYAPYDYMQFEVGV